MKSFAHYIITIGILLTSWISSYAQYEHPLHCVQVNDNGTITLNWEVYDNSLGAFTYYQLSKFDPLTNSYNLEQSSIININQTTYLDNDPGIDILNVSYCYRLEMLLDNGDFYIFPPLCSIVLDGVFDPILGVVDLTWNDPVPNDSSVPDGSVYNVYYQEPGGNWILDSSFPYNPGNQTFAHEVKTCNNFIDIRVELEFPNSNCASVSNEASVNVFDNNAPEAPFITSASVDSITGEAVLSWYTSTEPDAAGYIIYQCHDILGQIPVDTIFDVNAFEYNLPVMGDLSDPTVSNVGFLMAAFDDCPQNPLISQVGLTSVTPELCPSSFTTIFLAHNWVMCQDYVDLAWTHYTGWGEDGVAYYEVLRSTNNGPQESIAIIEDPEIQFYRDFDITSNDEYSYFIKAHSASVVNAVSISNETSLIINVPPPPTEFSISTATVMNEDQIDVILNSTVTTTPFTYFLQRRKEGDPFYQEIDFMVTDTPPVEFYDFTADPTVRSYKYRVALMNQCLDTVAYSNVGETIFLEGITNETDLTNTITWSAYGDWTNGIDMYEIYRSIDGEAYELIASTTSNIRFYEDDASLYLDSKGEFCYYIKAIETGNPIGLNAESLSNIICLNQPPKIWVSNALAVNGFNEVFKPIASYVDTSTFRLIIYNRWGQEIYQTIDIDEGWDGTKKGNLVQEGMYMYYMEVKNGQGKLFEHRGPVTLLILDSN